MEVHIDTVNIYYGEPQQKLKEEDNRVVPLAHIPDPPLGPQSEASLRRGSLEFRAFQAKALSGEGKSIGEIADQIGVSRSTVYAYLNGTPSGSRTLSTTPVLDGNQLRSLPKQRRKEEARRLRDRGKTAREIATKMNLSYVTIYKYLKED